MHRKLDSDLIRGVGPAAILKLLSRQDMYGYQLVEALSRQSDGILILGQSTLYPMLYNLEAKGLIESYWQEAGDKASRDRKYYRITSSGTRQLASESEQLERVVKAARAIGLVSSIVIPAPAFQGALA